MYIEISDKQFNKLLQDYIDEIYDTEVLHKLIMKLLKDYTEFDGCHWDKISAYALKQKQLDEEREL